PSTFGAGLDPSTRKRDRNPALFGTGKWNRVLIDATMNLDYDPDPDFGGARFSPTGWPARKDIATAKARWAGPGLDKPAQQPKPKGPRRQPRGRVSPPVGDKASAASTSAVARL